MKNKGNRNSLRNFFQSMMIYFWFSNIISVNRTNRNS